MHFLLNILLYNQNSYLNFLILNLPRHDSDPKHGGVSGRCNNPPQGLMSDGLDLPHKWSTCSDNDFKTWWRQKGHACVKPI